MELDEQADCIAFIRTRNKLENLALSAQRKEPVMAETNEDRNREALENLKRRQRG